MLPPGKAKERLELTLDRADQAIAEGRDAVYDLRSSATTTNDLTQAVRSLCNELTTPDAAEFNLTVEGPPRDLHPIIRDELYRIIREALRNAFTHARAHHIEAELIYAERLFRLRVRDDGQGIEPAVLEEVAPAIMACQECASALDKSARSLPSGAALGPALRSRWIFPARPLISVCRVAVFGGSVRRWDELVFGDTTRCEWRGPGRSLRGLAVLLASSLRTQRGPG